MADWRIDSKPQKGHYFMSGVRDGMTIECSNPDTVAELYHELRPYALSKTEYMTGHMDIAQDIVHDVFVRLWQKKPSFSSARAAYAWIYASCHNAAIDYLRSSRRAALYSSDVALVAVSNPRTPQDRAANREFLVAIFDRLNRRETEVLAYRLIDGLQLKDIALLMGISEKTVQRTIGALQEKIDDLRGDFDESFKAKAL